MTASDDLGDLLLEVHRARADLAHQRHHGNRTQEDVSRGALLAALEEYVATLERRRLPPPPSLRSELRILRGWAGR